MSITPLTVVPDTEAKISFPGTREGQIAERLAQAELLSRHYEIAIPVVDSGADLIVLNGRGGCVTIQVKSVTARRHHGGVRYLFTSRKGWRADLNLLCGHAPSCSWWIIPSEDIRERGLMRTLTLAHPEGRTWGKRPPSGWNEYFNAWHILDAWLAR